MPGTGSAMEVEITYNRSDLIEFIVGGAMGRIILLAP